MYNISPIYPTEIFDDLISNSKVNDNSKILEITTSTAISTLPMFCRGLNIKSIDLYPKNIKTNSTQKIQFKNLNIKTDLLINSVFNLVYITKAIFLNQQACPLSKAYDLLTSNGKLATIEVRTIPNSQNKLINEFEKKILKTIFSYSDSQLKDFTEISTSEYPTDLYNILFYKIYKKKVEYTIEKYELFIKSLPEYNLLSAEDQKYIDSELEKISATKSVNEIITKQYVFILNIFEKKEIQLKLTI